MELLHTFGFWHWLILGVLLIILEIFAPGVVFLWVGVAAIVTGVIAWLVPDLSLQWQMIIFAVLAVSSVLAASRALFSASARVRVMFRGLPGSSLSLSCAGLAATYSSTP